MFEQLPILLQENNESERRSFTKEKERGRGIAKVSKPLFEFQRLVAVTGLVFPLVQDFSWIAVTPSSSGQKFTAYRKPNPIADEASGS